MKKIQSVPPAPLLLTAGVVSFFWPVVFTDRVFYLKDAMTWFYPSRLLWRERVLSGDLPLWIPQLDLGMPFLANPEYSTLYPLNLILLLPAPACVGQFLIVHSIIAALGTYSLLCLLDIKRSNAAFGGIAYCLSGYLVSMYWSGAYLLSIAWMPYVVSRGLIVVRRRTPRDAAVFSLVLGCQLLTCEAQGVLLTGMLLGALVVAEPNHRIAGLAWLVPAAIIGFALAMPQILPTLSYLQLTKRSGGMGLLETSAWPLHPLRLLEFVVGGVFGNPNRYDGYIGFFLENNGEPISVLPWSASSYQGSLCLFFAVFSLIGTERKNRRWIGAIAILAITVLFLSLGNYTPVFSFYQRHIPGASFFRYPSKFVSLLTLCLAMMAGAGMDQSFPNKVGLGVQKRTIWAALLAFSLLLIGASFFAPSIGKALPRVVENLSLDTVADTIKQAMLLEGGLLAALALSLLLISKKHTGFVGPAACAALFIQILVMNHHIAPTMTADLYRNRSPFAEQIVADTPATEPVRMYYDGRYPPVYIDCLKSLSPEEVATWNYLTLTMNFGAIHGVGYPGAYSALAVPEHDRFWEVASGFRQQALNLLSVRHGVVPNSASLPADAGAEPLPELSRYCVVAYRGTMTLRFIRPVSGIPVESFEEALEEVIKPNVLVGKEAAIQDMDRVSQSPESNSKAGECEYSRPEGDSIEALCRLERESWIVINGSFHPNWTASIDGKQAKVHRANAIVMAVRVPAGTHSIKLSYGEPLLKIGAHIALLGLLSVSFLFFLQFSKSKKAWLHFVKLLRRQA